jgi:hypothetical protein
VPSAKNSINVVNVKFKTLLEPSDYCMNCHVRLYQETIGYPLVLNMKVHHWKKEIYSGLQRR